MTTESSRFEPRLLGKTGFMAGPLGLSGGYGVPSAGVEMAYEAGCNYFYHGSLRRKGMTDAIKKIVDQGGREKIFVLCQVYWRWGYLFRRSFNKFLALTGLESVDAILLGWYNSLPPAAILSICEELKRDGKVRYLAISGHERKKFPEFHKTGLFDIFHIRYNAVHRGAETEIFPLLPGEQAKREGVVIFTTTCWGKLANIKKLPGGLTVPRPSDSYRYVLSNPGVDVSLAGPKNIDQMKEALSAIYRGPMNADELDWMRKVGDAVR